MTGFQHPLCGMLAHPTHNSGDDRREAAARAVRNLAVLSNVLLDLCYVEDSAAEVDMNVVMTSTGEFVEVQGTAEGGTFGRDVLNRQLDFAEKGIRELIALQNKVLGVE